MKALLIMTLLFSSTLGFSALNANNVDMLDNTLTGKTELTVEHTSVEERMQDKQLEFERQKLLLTAKMNEQPSQMSGKTKTFFYIVGGAFILGTVGVLRKFTWISDKAFKAKDWTFNKAEDLWDAAFHGRVVKVKKKDYDNLVNSVNSINEQLRRAREAKEANPENNINEDVIDGNLHFTDDIADPEADYDEIYQQDKKEYEESKFMHNGNGFRDTLYFGRECEDNSSFPKTVGNAATRAPVVCANLVLKFFTKKQIKYWTPFKKEG